MSTLTDSAFWILSSLAGGPRHGYGILQEVEHLGGTRLKVPTLYTALDRLEREGRIEVSGEEVVDGRARRYYRLTPAGAGDLRTEAEALARRARIAQERLAAAARPAAALRTAASSLPALRRTVTGLA